jgi:pimeloyl-ACP methyl ester carboxylesterase
MTFLERRVARLAADVLHVSDAGHTDVFLVHGLGFAKECYRPLMRAMASSVPSVRSLVAVDLPSHGDSDAVQVRTDQGESYIAWSDVSERVREAAQAWRAERSNAHQLAVFAHSMGGAVSLQASMQQPGIFDSLFLAEPIILPPPFTHRFSDMPPHSPAPSALKRRSTFRSADEAWRYYEHRDGYSRWNREALRLLIEHSFRPSDDGSGSITMKLAPKLQADLYCGGQDTRLFEVLRKNAYNLPPVTLIAAESTFFNDTKSRPTLFEAICAMVRPHTPSFESVLVGDGATHTLVFEDDALMSQLFATHLRRAAAAKAKL